MVARETHGMVVVFGFGHDEVSDVSFLGLHGFNIKEDMQGWYAVVPLLLLLGCGIHTRPTFSARTSRPFPFLVLRFGGCLNETVDGFHRPRTHDRRDNQYTRIDVFQSCLILLPACHRLEQRRRRKQTEEFRLVTGLPAWSLTRCIWIQVSPKKSR